MTQGFFETITADQYAISTNGEKFNHPSMVTLEMIARARRNHEYTVNYPYRQQKPVAFHASDRGMGKGCRVAYRDDANPSLLVRPL